MSYNDSRQKSPQVSVLSLFPLYHALTQINKRGKGIHPQPHPLIIFPPTAQEINDLLTATQTPKAVWSLEGRESPQVDTSHLDSDASLGHQGGALVNQVWDWGSQLRRRRSLRLGAGERGWENFTVPSDPKLRRRTRDPKKKAFQGHNVLLYFITVVDSRSEGAHGRGKRNDSRQKQKLKLAS